MLYLAHSCYDIDNHPIIENSRSRKSSCFFSDRMLSFQHTHHKHGLQPNRFDKRYQGHFDLSCLVLCIFHVRNVVDDVDVFSGPEIPNYNRSLFVSPALDLFHPFPKQGIFAAYRIELGPKSKSQALVVTNENSVGKQATLFLGARFQPKSIQAWPIKEMQSRE